MNGKNLHGKTSLMSLSKHIKYLNSNINHTFLIFLLFFLRILEQKKMKYGKVCTHILIIENQFICQSFMLFILEAIKKQKKGWKIEGVLNTFFFIGLEEFNFGIFFYNDGEFPGENGKNTFESWKFKIFIQSPCFWHSSH